MLCGLSFFYFQLFFITKGQLISKCLFEKIIWTKIPSKNLIDSAHYTCWAKSFKFFVGILVQTIFSKRHFEINWPLKLLWQINGWVLAVLIRLFLDRIQIRGSLTTKSLLANSGLWQLLATLACFGLLFLFLTASKILYVLANSLNFLHIQIWLHKEFDPSIPSFYDLVCLN